VDRTLSLVLKFTGLDRLSPAIRKIIGGTKALSRDVAATRAQLGAFNRTQQQIAAYKGLENRLRADAAALVEAKEKTAALRAAMAATSAPTKKMAADLARAEREVERLETRTAGQGRELQDLSRRLGTAGVDVADLARHEERLAASTREATERLRQQQAALERAEATAARADKLKALGGNVTAAGAASLATGSAGLLGANALADDGREFEAGMTDIAQKANLTRAQARAMGDELLALGPKVAQMPQALQKGVDTLSGFGLDPKLGMKLIRPIGTAATAYKAEIDDISKATFAGIDNLKVPIADAGRQLDIMAAAGKAGAFEMRDMATYFPSLTAAASGLGQKGVGAVADLAAALQITRKGAGESSEAANNLLNLMNKINTEDAAKNFKEFGIDLPAAMKKAAAESKSPIEAIVELTQQATKGDQSQLSRLFGDAQVQAALRPLLQNMDLYRKIRADALKAQGTVATDFAERMNDSATKAAIFDAKMGDLKVTLGTALAPSLDALQAKVGTLADRFMAWAKLNPGLVSGLAGLLTGASALLVIAGGLGLVVGPIITGFGYLLPLLTGLWSVVRVGATVFRILTLAMMSNPVLALAVGIGIAAYLIYTHWDTIKAAFVAAGAWLGGLWTRFKVFGANIIQGLVDGITSKVAAIKSTILSIGKSVAGWFRGVLGIHSPSRVFMGLGGHIARGLAIGVDKGAAEPVQRIRSLAARMTTAVSIGAATPVIAAGPATAPPIAAAGTAAGAAPITIQIVQLPGEDAAALARRVADEIERRRGAARRSNYEDD